MSRCDCYGQCPTCRADMQPAPATEQASEDVLVFAIQVEKLLCAALGREWSTAGISIESLIAELTRRATQAERVQSSDLVPLPKAKHTVDIYSDNGRVTCEDAYSVDQMRAIYTQGYTFGHADGYASCARRATASKAEAPGVALLSIEKWHEEYRDCLFFHFENFEEPPEVYCGSPDEHGFDEFYWTHFVRFDFNSIIEQAIAANTKQSGAA